MKIRNIPKIIRRKMNNAKYTDLANLSQEITFYCYYIHVANEPKASKNRYDELISQSVTTTYIDLNLALEIDNRFTNNLGEFKGVIASIESRVVNQSASTTTERLINAQVYTILSDKDIPLEDNVLRVFRTSKVPSSYLGSGDSKIEIIKDGKIVASEYKKYEALYIKNFFLVGKSEEVLAGKKTGRYKYTFEERILGSKENSKVLFTTVKQLDSTPGGGGVNVSSLPGGLPSKDQLTKDIIKTNCGVSKIVLSSRKKAIINHITIKGNTVRNVPQIADELNSYIDSVSGTGSDEVKWKLLLVKPQNFQNLYLDWYSPWVAEINFATQIGLNGSDLKSDINNTWQSSNSNNGVVNVMEFSTQGLTPSVSNKSQAINKIFELLHWGSKTAKEKATWIQNNGAGLLRKAYVQSGDDFTYNNSAINYKLVDDKISNADSQIKLNRYSLYDNEITNLLGSSAARAVDSTHYLTATTKNYFQKNAALYKPFFFGFGRSRQGAFQLKLWEAFGMVLLGLIPNEYYNSPQFLLDFLKDDFKYNNQVKIKFPTDEEKDFNFRLGTSYDKKFNALNNNNLNKYFVLYYEDNYSAELNQAYHSLENGYYLNEQKVADLNLKNLTLKVKRVNNKTLRVNYYNVKFKEQSSVTKIDFELPADSDGSPWADVITQNTASSTTYTVSPYALVYKNKDILLTKSQIDSNFNSSTNGMYTYEGDHEFYRVHVMDSSVLKKILSSEISAIFKEPVLGAYKVERLKWSQKNVSQNFYLHGAQNKTFDNESTSNFQETKLKKEYFSEDKDWQLTINLKKHNQTYTLKNNETYNSIDDGYVISSLSLGFYCWADIDIKMYDNNNKLIQDEVFLATTGRRFKATTYTKQYSVKAQV